MMAELKPCPFCGGEAKHYFASADGHFLTNCKGNIWGRMADHHTIRCYRCGVQTKVYATNKGAFNAWNRRADNE